MYDIIVLPDDSRADTSGFNRDYKFGYYETMNSKYRDEQEDALAWQVLECYSLNPIEIAHRLWTSYLILDEPQFMEGTTASTTIYNGREHLITATLADAAAFAAVYDKEGAVLGVRRLNSVTHKLTNPDEMRRIKQVGGIVVRGRIAGRLEPSRAIGDAWAKRSGVCSEAQIDIVPIEKLISELNIDPGIVGSIQIIATCDGFTEATFSESKTDHELYLLNCLKHITAPAHVLEDELAKHLVSSAKRDCSQDNISVAIQTLILDCPVMIGVYDGHSGKKTSSYVAQNIGRVFREQCSLSLDDYEKQSLSVTVKRAEYIRDNHDGEMMSGSAGPVKNSTGLLKGNSFVFFSESQDSTSLPVSGPVIQLSGMTG